MSTRSQVGDGDACPADPEHGRMIVTPDRKRQWCPVQTHDGVWGTGDHKAPTQAFFPLYMKEPK